MVVEEGAAEVGGEVVVIEVEEAIEEAVVEVALYTGGGESVFRGDTDKNSAEPFGSVSEDCEGREVDLRGGGVCA
jgi:hypothetical protein